METESYVGPTTLVEAGLAGDVAAPDEAAGNGDPANQQEAPHPGEGLLDGLTYVPL